MIELSLAQHDDLETLLPMVIDCHAEQHVPKPSDHLIDSLVPLLEGSPYGAIYLAGPRETPLGYAILTFSWSIEQRGMDGEITEIYVQPDARGQRIGTHILNDLSKALTGSRLKSLNLKIDPHNTAALKFYNRMQFQVCEHQILMTKAL